MPLQTYKKLDMAALGNIQLHYTVHLNSVDTFWTDTRIFCLSFSFLSLNTKAWKCLKDYVGTAPVNQSIIDAVCRT